MPVSKPPKSTNTGLHTVKSYPTVSTKALKQRHSLVLVLLLVSIELCSRLWMFSFKGMRKLSQNADRQESAGTADDINPAFPIIRNILVA